MIISVSRKSESMTWIKRPLVLLAVLFTSAHAQSPVAGPARIILLRHAEKPADPEDSHLSPAGVKRAERLVSFIMKDPAMSRFGSPVAVFASQTTKHDNGQRSQETVAPLARALKLQVQTPFRSKDYAALAKLILANSAYAGKTVLICWTHEEIPKLASALGVKPRPPKWKDSVFDKVYVISYQSGKATLATLSY
jgi:phosphohistidine phosphatase SixA